MKKRLLIPATVAASVMPSAYVFAEEVTSGVANSAVTNAMTTVANDMVATGNAVVPIALTVVGISLVVVYGVRIFRKLAKP